MAQIASGSVLLKEVPGHWNDSYLEMQCSAIRNEFAHTKSHQARVTKNLQHDDACRDQKQICVLHP